MLDPMTTVPPDQSATSTLGAVAGSDPSQVSQAQPTPAAQPQAAPAQQPAAPPAPQPTSRLSAIVQAVAKVADTALAGIPDRGRPSFTTGLGEGARAEQQEQANQQAIKFKTFDDQVRLAQLHNQDLKMQQDTQEQQDAHTKAELDNRKLANDLGIDYDTIANHGGTVMDHLTAQTAATGAASVPAGTHISADGENINIPKDTQDTRDGQKKMYAQLAPALGLPSLPDGAQLVPNRLMDMLTNKVHGFDLGGNPIKHDDLPGVLGAEKQQRDQLAKNSATPAQLQALDNVIAIHQANLDALDKHAAGVKQQSKQAELDAENSPQSIAGAAKLAGAKANAELPSKIALQKAAAENKNDSTELNAVAFDPTYKNPDGTLGANVVMSKSDAADKGLQHYKANPEKLNALVGGFNDVQNKLNQLASVANDPNKMNQVQAPIAAAMLKHGKGIEIGAFGTKLDTSGVNEEMYNANLRLANQATRDYVTAMVAAHEAITQLPRLQTFGQSSRMTEQQMEAAQNLLPHPGDDGRMAAQKMQSLQTIIDPLRKQVPHMPGAEQIPSWVETQKQQQQRQTPSGGSNLGKAVMGNPIDYINSLQPTQ